MRKALLCLILLVAGSSSIVAAARVQTVPSPENPPLESAPDAGWSSFPRANSDAIALQPVDRAPISIPAAADKCTGPITTELSIDYNYQYSGSFSVDKATSSADDPEQSCSWGGASANSRSVWWRVLVPEDGQLTVSTLSGATGTYDTVAQLIEQASAVRGYRWNMMETAQADLIIEPKVKPYYWWQFSRAADCIAAGQEAARASLGKVRDLMACVPDGGKLTKRAELAEYYPHIIL